MSKQLNSVQSLTDEQLVNRYNRMCEVAVKSPRMARIKDYTNSSRQVYLDEIQARAMNDYPHNRGLLDQIKH